ncbi:hypothetical protein RHGRI_034779 [Rhododendron griersonianum]|uniref:Biotin carboxyl carrier protein of acetyl-CoA carboxylase n=1 Tax=Rhododendron griersonianum TaxID=479676 RepID=A0AAV6I2U4_9ERIC|nr:hypothetical protein RHGRI_034779 [Rhododendron griersonianum]
MASFTVPCPKTSALLAAPRPAPKQQPQQCAVAFKPTSIAGSSLRFQGSRHKQSGAFKVSAQLNEVAIKESSNCAPVPETETEESTAENIVPDASSITAFMTQVQDIVEYVETPCFYSRDIVELHLKQQGCELIIRKKEALQQQAAPAPTVMMQSSAPQAMWPFQMPPAPVSAPASAAPVSAAPAPSPPVSAPALPSPAKPKSSHPPMKCPMAGTFYRCPAPGAPSFVKEGDVVQKGQVLCIVEAMKLMNEIESDRSGTIVEVLASDGKPVSVDTPLFVIAP